MSKAGEQQKHELPRWQRKSSTRASVGDTWVALPPYFGHQSYDDELQQGRATDRTKVHGKYSFKLLHAFTTNCRQRWRSSRSVAELEIEEGRGGGSSELLGASVGRGGRGASSS